MYYISSCHPIYFLKFVVHKMNSKMVKLPERKKVDVADADMVVC
jgi:hypothetical protein